MNIELKPYDHDCADTVFSELFGDWSFPEREDGLVEMPSASYQLVVSALELIQWETSGQDRQTIMLARSIVEQLRDIQKRREWNRLAFAKEV